MGDNGVLITHNVVEPAPQLAIITAGGNALLSWPTSSSGYTLTSSTNLASMNWEVVAPAPVVQGANYVVTNGIGAGAMFYRLRKP